MPCSGTPSNLVRKPLVTSRARIKSSKTSSKNRYYQYEDTYYKTVLREGSTDCKMHNSRPRHFLMVWRDFWDSIGVYFDDRKDPMQKYFLTFEKSCSKKVLRATFLTFTLIRRPLPQASLIICTFILYYDCGGIIYTRTFSSAITIRSFLHHDFKKCGVSRDNKNISHCIMYCQNLQL